MKKLAAVLTVCVLLVSLLSFSVSAEGFVFKELSRANDDKAMQVTWNHTEIVDGDELEDVLLGGISCPFTFDEEKTLIVDINGLDAGVYSVVYEYVSGTQQGKTNAKPFTKTGIATVKLTGTINENGTVTITAKNGSGVPVPNYKLSLTIGNMSGLSRQTDANGKFTSFEKVDYGKSVKFAGVETAGIVTYSAAAEQTLTRSQQATTTGAAIITAPTTTGTTAETTETTVEGETTTAGDETTTEAKEETTVAATTTTQDPYTIVTIVGKGTTDAKDGKIILNASTDTGILNLLGCTVEEFSDRARLYIDEEDYNSLVGRNNSNRLMLNMLSAENPASEAQIRAALGEASEFSKYAENECSWVTFDLSFLILDKSGKQIPVSAMPIGSTYVVELPVPESMRGCKELAITMKDGSGLMTPVKVAVSGGVFKLQINSLEPYTLIGFGTGGSDKAGGVSGWVVLLYVAGGLLLAGAGVLLYFFVFRKPAEAAQQEEEAPVIFTQPQDDGNDIYSGRTDMPPTDGD